MKMDNTNPNKQQWCKENAEQFSCTKNSIKRYPVEVEYQDGNETLYLVLTDEEVKKHTEFQEKERKAFLDDNPDMTSDKKAWNEWLQAAYRDEFNSGLFDKIYLDESIKADITMVHLDEGCECDSQRTL